MSGETFCYIHIYRHRAGELDSSIYANHRQAMEAAAEEWPNLRYVGTVVVPRDGSPSFEDWTEDVEQRKREAARDAEAQDQERRAHRQRVL